MKRGHTNTHRNKRVAVTLKNGDVIYDRFVERPKHNRWIELKFTGRLAISEVSTLSDYKGPVECDGRRHVLVVQNVDGSTSRAGDQNASRVAEA